VEPILAGLRDFRQTIKGYIADLRRVGKGGSGLSLPKFYDFYRLSSIFFDPLCSMVAPARTDEFVPINLSERLGNLGVRAIWVTQEGRPRQGIRVLAIMERPLLADFVAKVGC
jgi:hypothetical protein